MGVFKRWVKGKDGSNTAYWYARYRVNGKDKWESVGKVGEVTKLIAQRRLEDIKRKIRKGIYDYEDNTTIESIEDEYIKHLRDIKKLRTLKDRERDIKTLKDFFKNKLLSQITPKDIDDFKSSRLEEVKPSSVNRELSTLKNIFNLARRWRKFYGENPVSISGLLSEDNQRDSVLSLEEQERLLANSSEHLKPILICALHTGMRRGEILSLTWVDVDFDNNLFIINASNNKSKKKKKVPVNSYLKKMLLELKLRNQAKSDHVFLGDDDKPVKDIKTAFKNACRRARIPHGRKADNGITFHDLKHTAATRMHEAGVDIVTIGDVLGNSSIQMLRNRYLHPDNSKREAVEKLASFEKSCSNNCSNEKFDS